MVDFTLQRSAEVFVEHELSTEDRFAILDWILGELNGPETDAYPKVTKYPMQIKRMAEGLGDDEYGGLIHDPV